MLPLAPGNVCLLCDRRVLGDGERLKPSDRRRLETHLCESTREIRGGRIRARPAGHAARELVVAQELDVVDGHQWRRDGPFDRLLGGTELLRGQRRGGARNEAQGNDDDSVHRGTKSAFASRRDAKLASRRAVRSRSSSTIISLGLCM